MQDAIALLRLEDLYVESFEIKDVKVCRAVGSELYAAEARVEWGGGENVGLAEGGCKAGGASLGCWQAVSVH